MVPLAAVSYSASLKSMYQIHQVGATRENLWAPSGVPVQNAQCWDFWVWGIICRVGRVSMGPNMADVFFWEPG
jgi:hypothetical protein